ncbi:MAG: helix-turn-helix domain-containing protein [Treponema sp.]
MFLVEQQELVIKRLRQEREKAGLSQLELALRADVSQNMINYIETGKRTPSLDTLLKICNALNINPAVLFSDSKEEKEKAKKEILEMIQRWM